MSSNDSFVSSGNSPTHSERIRPDFLVENHGSFLLLKSLTPLATSWIEVNIGQGNGFQPYSPAIVVEHHYIADIVAGIRNDGWLVSA